MLTKKYQNFVGRGGNDNMDDMKNNQTKLCYIKNKNKLTGTFLGPR